MTWLDEQQPGTAQLGRPRLLLDPKAPWTLVLISNSEEAHARCDKSYELRDADLHPSPGADLLPA